MIELSVAGPLLAKADGQIWQVRARTKDGVVIKEGNFRQMATILMRDLAIDAEELEAAVSFMLNYEHDVAHFGSDRKCAFTYNSKSRKRMDK